MTICSHFRRRIIMRKFYEKNEVLFAVFWILVYCFVMAPVRGEFGDESIWSVLALALIAAGTTVFVKINHLEEKYGLTGWPKNTKKYLYFIPMWILVTGNLWGGFAPAYSGTALVFAVLSMLFVGYVEEMLFRGFLFKALASKNSIRVAIIISAVTFGVGHIINLLTGQGDVETVIQVIFAVVWGFIFTLVFFKSKSLLPGILAHGLIDVFSKFSADNIMIGWIYRGAVIVVAIAYCIYLVKATDGTESM